MISALILAAGQSSRMGQPKMLLPWGRESVLEHVISVFAAAGIEEIVVATGAVQQQIERILADLAGRYPVRFVHNPDYQNGEMLSSLQCGLHALRTPHGRNADGEPAAALVGLGDQPQVQERSIRLVCEAFTQTKSLLVVPSFQMRRGHPWLVSRPLWQDLLEMRSPHSPRDFLNAHAKDIHYVSVDTPSIFADLDTPEDYQAARP